jgi:hypothetical protein
MKLTSEEGRRIVFEDHDDWTKVEEAIIDTRRWSNRYLGVFSHKPTGRFYQMSWSVGATEEQDESPFECETPELTEVIEKEVTITKWVPA